MSEFIPPHGGYKKLLSPHSRARDQMILAARSDKQNIIEGSMASAASKETEIKLTSVARASFEELLADYYDFLRVRSHEAWDKNSKEALFVRRLGAEHREKFNSFAAFRKTFEARPPEVLANIVICIIHRKNYLLDRQLRKLESDFIREGGIRERMTKARIEHR